METRNAVITGARLTTADHNLLSAWLYLDYGDVSQGFGGYTLYLPKDFKHHELKTFAGHYIWRMMEIAGVEDWDDLEGKTIRVRCTNSKVEAIGHIIKDDWFEPDKEFAELSDTVEEVEREMEAIHARCKPHDDKIGPHHDEECEKHFPF
jgi:hypothetical protein